MRDATFFQVRASNLREQVVEQVRAAIIQGHLKPGDHIVEANLTEQLGVSRTPVREALILLEREGLVIAEPHRGSFVKAFTQEEVDAVFSMRTTLENFAAERVTKTLTEDDFARLNALIAEQKRYIEQDDFEQVRITDMAFHSLLIEKANHPLLTRAWQELVAQIAAVLYLRADAIPDYDEMQAIGDHQVILEALQARDLASVKAHNARINARVADECRRGVEGKG